MAAQSVAPNRRKQSSDSDDVVLARAIEFGHWARENVRAIVIAAVLVAVVAAGVVYYRYYQAQRLERAATEFLALEQTLSSGNVELATRDLQRYVDRFEGTTYAAEARIALGQLYRREGQSAEAVAVLRPFADEIDETPVGPQGALLLASSLQDAGETEEAIRTYLAVADESELLYVRADALENAAILRKQAEDYAGAAEIYQRLVAMTEEGGLDRSIYEMRLAEAEARAEAAS